MTKGRILVTGGAGYIGAVTVEALLERGAERVVVLDDLSRGHAAAVTPPAQLVRGDIADGALVEDLLRRERIDAVVHFAAWSLVGESVTQPARYYHANTVKTLALVDAMLAAGVKRLVFSSTAATYGEPTTMPITEETAQLPTNPYGETKLAIERALKWYEGAYGLRYCALRYFNAAGATARNGEDHSPETHLIPIVLQVAAGKREHLSIFGSDYPTVDGTCVRDYIHVRDLAEAHVLAVGGLAERSLGAYNLGCGGGFTVKQVVEAAERVTGKKIAVQIGPRRSGDPASLVASSQKITRELGWKPTRDLETIIRDAWAWHSAHPTGYPDNSSTG